MVKAYRSNYYVNYCGAIGAAKVKCINDSALYKQLEAASIGTSSDLTNLFTYCKEGNKVQALNCDTKPINSDKFKSLCCNNSADPANCNDAAITCIAQASRFNNLSSYNLVGDVLTEFCTLGNTIITNKCTQANPMTNTNFINKCCGGSTNLVYCDPVKAVQCSTDTTNFNNLNSYTNMNDSTISEYCTVGTRMVDNHCSTNPTTNDKFKQYCCPTSENCNQSTLQCVLTAAPFYNKIKELQTNNLSPDPTTFCPQGYSIVNDTNCQTTIPDLYKPQKNSLFLSTCCNNDPTTCSTSSLQCRNSQLSIWSNVTDLQKVGLPGSVSTALTNSVRVDNYSPTINNYCNTLSTLSTNCAADNTYKQYCDMSNCVSSISPFLDRIQNFNNLDTSNKANVAITACPIADSMINSCPTLATPVKTYNNGFYTTMCPAPPAECPPSISTFNTTVGNLNRMGDSYMNSQSTIDMFCNQGKDVINKCNASTEGWYKDIVTGNSQYQRWCPSVDCQVSEWSHYNVCDCSVTNPTQSRNRTITTQPKNAGKVCPPLTETIPCNNCDIYNQCIIDADKMSKTSLSDTLNYCAVGNKLVQNSCSTNPLTNSTYKSGFTSNCCATADVCNDNQLQCITKALPFSKDNISILTGGAVPSTFCAAGFSLLSDPCNNTLPNKYRPDKSTPFLNNCCVNGTCLQYPFGCSSSQSKITTYVNNMNTSGIPTTIDPNTATSQAAYYNARIGPYWQNYCNELKTFGTLPNPSCSLSSNQTKYIDTCDTIGCMPALSSYMSQAGQSNPYNFDTLFNQVCPAGTSIIQNCPKLKPAVDTYNNNLYTTSCPMSQNCMNNAKNFASYISYGDNPNIWPSNKGMLCGAGNNTIASCGTDTINGFYASWVKSNGLYQKYCTA